MEEGTGEERCEMLSSEQDVDIGLTAAWLHAQNLLKVKPIKPVNIWEGRTIWNWWQEITKGKAWNSEEAMLDKSFLVKGKR